MATPDLLDNVTATTAEEKLLNYYEKQILEEQNKRLISDFQANKLEIEARKHWDLFYKRNKTKFFKDRHWITREFQELLEKDNCNDSKPNNRNQSKSFLEVGCGVGNFLYPLIEQFDSLDKTNYFFYACDFSARAIDFLRANPLYDISRIKAIQCDITTSEIHDFIPEASLDVISMVFVLSAISPEKFDQVIKNLYKLLKFDGIVLFRDYGRYDMAQLRFKPGHKIAENFYMRLDGTRSYYFSKSELDELFNCNNFDIITSSYVHRRTTNIKESLDVQRIFLQAKFQKLPQSG